MRLVMAILLVAAVLYAVAGIYAPGPAKRLYSIDELVPPVLVGQEV